MLLNFFFSYNIVVPMIKATNISISGIFIRGVPIPIYVISPPYIVAPMRIECGTVKNITIRALELFTVQLRWFFKILPEPVGLIF